MAQQGVTGLSRKALAVQNTVWDPDNTLTQPDVHFDGLLRWLNGKALSLVKPDTNNRHGTPSVTFDSTLVSGSLIAGKFVQLSDFSLEIGDTPSWELEIYSTGGSWRGGTRPYNAAGTVVATATNGSDVPLAFSGDPGGTITHDSLKVTSAPIPAGTTQLLVFVEYRGVAYVGEDTGAAGALKCTIEAWKGSAGTYMPLLASATPADPARRYQPVRTGLVWDSLNQRRTPAETAWDGHARWVNGSLLSIVTDSAGRYQGKSLEMAYAVSPTFAGKNIPLAEIGVGVGDTLVFWAHVRAMTPASYGTGRLSARFFQADGVTAVGAQLNGPSTTFTGAVQPLHVPAGAVPAGAVYIEVYLVRSSGTSVFRIDGMDGLVISQFGSIAPAANPTDFWAEIADARFGEDSLADGITAQIAASSGGSALFPASQDAYGRHFLSSLDAQLAKIDQGVTDEIVQITTISDSWGANLYITDPLTQACQDRWGDAGSGWVPFFTTGMPLPTVPAGLSRTRGGTWVESDQLATSKGLNVTHVSTTDTSAYYELGFVGREIHVQYIEQVDGGDWRGQIDGAGPWTTVNTANASDAFGVESWTGLTNAAHTLRIEIPVAGAAGVILTGWRTRKAGNGVIVSTVANPGITTAQYVAVDATLWKAALADENPHLIIILLGTNDHSHDVDPALFETQTEELIDRCQDACPNARVLLWTASANDLSTVYPLSDYATKYRDIGVARSIAVLDMLKNLPTFTIADDLGLMLNPSHLNSIGGQFHANRGFRLLEGR